MEEYSGGKYAWSKVIWDIANIGLFNVPIAYDMVIRSTPMVFEGCRYSFDDSRHKMIYVRKLKRDFIFADLFKKLAAHKNA